MPAHAHSTARRLVLVPAAAASPQARTPAAVRRYRLGRLGFGPPPGEDRYAYLKRGHD